MKIRNSTYPEVDECIRKWFVQCRDQNLPVSGLILQQTAEDFSKELKSNSEFNANFLDVVNELQTCGSTMTDKDIVANINAEIYDEKKNWINKSTKRYRVRRREGSRTAPKLS
ncbi:hypothetical protein AVEN_26210-1 [Araneus ventricosus]|uniref:HTH CENPB-type domain-containing protein n=1 Tax=Araneus ventricosus TaxID=182803 RepID=A0A4Y2ANE0_ARAVE|nr:hypothetical protein AVEN_26210-1 [Araneus ventricosus]